MPELTLRDVMTREFVGVSESDRVDGAVRVMREEGVESAVVLRGREPVGVLSAGDVLDLIADGGDPETTTVGDIMTVSVPSLDPDATVGEVGSVMHTTESNLVLVEDSDEVLGVVTARELARYTWDRRSVGENPGPVEQNIQSREAARAEEYSDQSICEACGTLSPDLVNVNGQLLCPDCRGV
ncbi:MAG: CBS domain-containing protein [Halanaeroarchaeum sp.]